MKTFSTVLMGLLILAGLILTITPFVADKFFPVPENVTRVAKPEAAALALKRFFKAPDALITDVQAMNKSNSTGATSLFSFSIGRRPVEKYIIENKLKQLEISPDILDTLFQANQPPASWWQPAALKQQTYFAGSHQGRDVALIYNPETKRGVLIAVMNVPHPLKVEGVTFLPRGF